MNAEPWYPMPHDPDSDNDVAICDCGAEDWQQVVVLLEPDPLKRVSWECRDCGRIYNADGKQVGHNG